MYPAQGTRRGSGPEGFNREGSKKTLPSKTWVSPPGGRAVLGTPRVRRDGAASLGTNRAALSSMPNTRTRVQPNTITKLYNCRTRRTHGSDRCRTHEHSEHSRTRVHPQGIGPHCRIPEHKCRTRPNWVKQIHHLMRCFPARCKAPIASRDGFSAVALPILLFFWGASHGANRIT